MNLHEYQGKSILKSFGVKVQEGIVVDKVNWEGDSHLVVHNIGGGAQYEDMLNSWPPDEVYRLTPAMIKKMQLDCTFKYNIDKDFMYYGN